MSTDVRSIADSGCSGATLRPVTATQGVGSVRADQAVAVRAVTSLDRHETNCGDWPFAVRKDTDHGQSKRRDLPGGPRASPPGRSQNSPPPSRTDLPRALSSANCLRHRSWWHDYLRVHRALEAAYPNGNRPVRFGACGLDAHVEVSDTDPPTYRLSAEYCRDRWCRPCQKERSRIIAANLLDYLDGYLPLFITLTIRTHGLSLQDSVIKLYNSFAQLRRTDLWQRCIEGGAVVCEIKRCQDDARWHPHLHVLATGKWIEQGWLGQEWLKITGDSYIVDVGRAADELKTAYYLCKYLRKPVPANIIRNHDHLVEAIKALQGRRLVATFGSWRGLKLTHTESQAAWTRMCTYKELVAKALKHDVTARRILSHLLGQADLSPSNLDNWIREMQTLWRSGLAVY